MQEIISWSAPEFVHYPKSRTWFVVLSLLAIGTTLYFLIKRDFLTAVLFILLFIIIFYYARAKPRTVSIRLDSKGVTINETHLSYQQIKSFWIVYEVPNVKTLNFETTAYFNRFLTLQLQDQVPVQIRDFLLTHIPEDLDREEPLSDKIARKLKF